MFIYISRECSQNVNICDANGTTHKSVDFVHQCTLKHYTTLNGFRVANTEQIILFSERNVTNLKQASSDPIIKPTVFDLENLNENILLGKFSNQSVLTSKMHSDELCTDSKPGIHTLGAMFDKYAGESFAKLECHFALMGWHQASNTLHVAKDPLNPTPFYWVELDHGVLVTSHIQLIRDVLGKPLALSQVGLSCWLSGYPNPAVALFKDVNVLPIGYRLEINKALNVNLIRFWDINPEHQIRYDSQQEYSRQFIDLLSDSVKEAMVSEKSSVVSQMSGGMDSTSITALAKDAVKDTDKQLLPLSHLYQSSVNCDEQALIDDMLSFLNIEYSIKMTVDQGADRNFLDLYPTDLQSPGTVLSPRYIRELELVKQAGADVLLTGNGGDEMCWGHSLAYTQRFKQGDLSVVAEVLKACPDLNMPRLKTATNLFVKPLVPDVLLKLLGKSTKHRDSFSPPIWLTNKAKELAYEGIKVDNPFNIKQDPVGYNRYLSMKTTSTYNALHSYDKLAQGFGIQVRHPFFDTQVAEFTFAIPEKQLIQGAYPKWLLRTSMQHMLPQSVCWNSQKTTFDQHFGSLVRENAESLREILKDERLCDMGLINRSLLLAEFDRVVADPSLPVQVDMLYAILTYSWLQTHFPD